MFAQCVHPFFNWLFGFERKYISTPIATAFHDPHDFSVPLTSNFLKKSSVEAPKACTNKKDSKLFLSTIYRWAVTTADWKIKPSNHQDAKNARPPVELNLHGERAFCVFVRFE